ncbi:unnamed protein product [Closterium sp. Naga37s-1]|nr:unnamed protein product [Closterium sp. Naga37s-1]
MALVRALETAMSGSAVRFGSLYDAQCSHATSSPVIAPVRPSATAYLSPLRHQLRLQRSRSSSSSSSSRSNGSVARRHSWRCMASGSDGGEEKKDGSSGEEKQQPASSSADSLPPIPAPPPIDDPLSSEPPPEFPSPDLKLPRAVIDSLRDRVFGFDTFFVTDMEPYEGGVLFRGNLRGDSERAYTKLTARLKEVYGDQYVLFLLESTDQDERPVAVVVPRSSLDPLPAPVPEWVAAGAFGAVTLVTVLLAYSPSPELGFIPSTEYLTGPLLEGLPAAMVFALLMAVHEAGHAIPAKQLGVSLSVPFFVPSFQLGSFGAVTRITFTVKSRSDLVSVAAPGPLAGMAASLAVLLLSLLLLRPEDGISVNAAAFHDSLLVGGLAKLLLGPQLAEGASLTLSPVTLAAWAALLVNAINCIPAGELDGGRIAMGLFGRKWASRMSLASLILLGITGIFNDVALFWVVLILFLQRGPVTPQANEITPPSDQAKILGAAALVLSVLVFAPLPVPF